MFQKYSKSILFILMLVLVNIILINACKKEVATYQLSGKVYDPQLKKNVSNATISLKASEIQSGVYNPNYIEIQSIKSASNGTYQFEVEHGNVSGYRLDFSKEHYFDQSIDIETEDMHNEAGLVENTDLIPIANITLTVKNTSPQGTDDEVIFRFKNVDVKCKECWNNEPIKGIGPSYSYSETKKVTGDKDIYIEWVVKKNSQQHIYQDTIQSKSFSTVNYNINY